MHPTSHFIIVAPYGRHYECEIPAYMFHRCPVGEKSSNFVGKVVGCYTIRRIFVQGREMLYHSMNLGSCMLNKGSIYVQ